MKAQPNPSPVPADPETPTEPWSVDPAVEKRPPPILGQRRRFLIHGTSQLRTGVLVTAVALVLLVLLNLSMHSARVHATSTMVAESPNLRPVLEAQNRFELVLGIGASIVFLLGIFAVTILETHKTVGAAYRVSRELERVGGGVYGAPLTLRRGDNLVEVATAFNEMTAALADRAALDVEELEHAASVADRVSNPPEAADLARMLRAMADERRRLTPEATRR